jgi:hypothetical protein
VVLDRAIGQHQASGDLEVRMALYQENSTSLSRSLSGPIGVARGLFNSRNIRQAISGWMNTAPA